MNRFDTFMLYGMLLFFLMLMLWAFGASACGDYPPPDTTIDTIKTVTI